MEKTKLKLLLSNRYDITESVIKKDEIIIHTELYGDVKYNFEKDRAVVHDKIISTGEKWITNFLIK